MPEAPPPRPVTLRLAIWLLAGEAVVMLAVLVFLLYEDVTGAAQTADAVTLFAASLVAIFGGLAWALRSRKAWARGPAIVVQMLLIPTGYTMVAGGLPVVGVPVILVGLVGAGTLLAPATRAAVGRK